MTSNYLEKVGFSEGVSRLVANRIEKFTSLMPSEDDLRHLMPGKMLRTQLAARLVCTGSLSVVKETLQRACAAVELVHTASLCHDDVVDNAMIRRANPTLWRKSGCSGAVLIGDLLLCEAIDMLVDVAGGRLVSGFLAKVREVVAAETEQELTMRGKRIDLQTCLRLARGKTGPLFAFVGQVCGGDDLVLSQALEEAGYNIGTAYQLADDLIDVLGDEASAGKTLGSDFLRKKFTMPQSCEQGSRLTIDHVRNLCVSALDCVAEYPEVRQGLKQYFIDDVQPVLEKQLDVQMELAV